MSGAISDGAARLASMFGDRLTLADGSTGTALEALAPEVAAGGRLALVPLEHPDILEALHKAYFDAGSDLVESATFSASARDLEPYAEGWLGGAGGWNSGAEALSYAVNRAAAGLAAKAARNASTGERRRLVAGSMGPGDAPPSLGSSTYAELLASYLPQARGLADGGADLAIIETCQDPLQIKATIAALRDQKGGRGLPFIVSATVDERGRMLAGTDIAAFVAIVSPFAPLALGLNCSGGPDELESSLEELTALSPFPICFMPNAGLPCSVDGCTSYPFGPEVFARKVEALARRFGVAIVGGCCGTGPAHIAALHARLGDRPRASERPAPRPALSSLYRARDIGPGLFKIGERANSAGSAAFAALLDAEDFEGMADKALIQEGSGASAIDLHLSRPGRDEAADLRRLVSLIAPRAQAALCLDSGDPEVLARALPFVGGRPLLNSTNLEDPERARRVFALAAEFGAAVVCLAMDGAGPARSVAEKTRVCRRLYDIATTEFGLPPRALLFDPLTFTIAAGGDAATTIEAIGAIKAACPGSLTVLGVGNVSYGLPKAARPAVTSLFVEAAVRAGLDAAIMDTGGIPAPGSIDPELRAAALLALGFEDPGVAGSTPDASAAPSANAASGASATPGASASGDRLDDLLAWAAKKGKDGSKSSQKPSVAGVPEPTAPESASEAPAWPQNTASALATALSRGDASRAETEGRRLAETEGAARLASAVTASMAESGRLWNEGLLSLPLVLRSAEAARRALSAIAATSASTNKGTVVMATVKGDLHDIGKNIVSAILGCSGWRVIDLGTNVSAAAIVEAALGKNRGGDGERDGSGAGETDSAGESVGAVAIGLSGLLTRSLSEMKTICEALQGAGSRSLVLCGGAAVDPSFVSREVEPKHPGLVLACADAFAAAKALDEFLDAKKAAKTSPRISAKDASREQRPSVSSPRGGTPIAPKTSPAFQLPFEGASGAIPIPFGEILSRLERNVLFSSRWGYRREEYAEAERELERLLPVAEPIAEPKAIYGYFNCRRDGETSLAIQATVQTAVHATVQTASQPSARSDSLDKPWVLPFPAERGGQRRSLASYFSPEKDAIAFFAATAGPGIARAARALKEEGRLEEYWRLHGLGSAIAEAAAQWVHDRIAAEIAAAGAPTRGKRYSFGFPACPGTEYQDALLELLGASRIGLRATEGHQLDPEHSVTAFVIARPDAAYFDA
ncbi:MAG TPA: homocysteine S-methyltransferase family protein [Rectinemataceae bacterium]|nr:homocysteine S-methyltransferase family protein [Rectinemataceae bacterium]